jgi:hypothetical protein
MGWGGKRSGAGAKPRGSTIARRLIGLSHKAANLLTQIPKGCRSPWISRLIEANAAGCQSHRLGDRVTRGDRSVRIVFVAPLGDRA